MFSNKNISKFIFHTNSVCGINISDGLSKYVNYAVVSLLKKSYFLRKMTDLFCEATDLNRSTPKLLFTFITILTLIIGGKIICL